MELGIDSVAAPGSDYIAASGPGMLLNNLAKLAYRSPRLYQFDSLVQALPCGFNHPNRVWAGFGSIANIVSLVEVGMVATVIERDVEVEDIAIEKDSLVRYPVTNDLVW